MNDGGPAFPIPGAVSHYDEGRFSDSAHVGASLRDYFATRAPFPIPEEWFSNYCRTIGFTSRTRAMADWAFDYADAMLEARQYQWK